MISIETIEMEMRTSTIVNPVFFESLPLNRVVVLGNPDSGLYFYREDVSDVLTPDTLKLFETEVTGGGGTAPPTDSYN